MVALACAAVTTAALAQEAGTSAPGEDNADSARQRAAVESGAELNKLLRGVKVDGSVVLPEPVQRELVALLPAARKGEECAEPATASAEAHALKDRGDGAVLFARIVSCKGAYVFAYSSGAPPRVARLLNLDADTQTVRAAFALNLAGGRREGDVALTIFTAPNSSTLRLYLRRPEGFVYSEAGVLPDYALESDCEGHAGEGSGWASFVKTDARSRLQVLRVDESCAGGPWQASCKLFALDRGALSRSGVCVLHQRMEPKALRSQGWR